MARRPQLIGYSVIAALPLLRAGSRDAVLELEQAHRVGVHVRGNKKPSQDKEYERSRHLLSPTFTKWLVPKRIRLLDLPPIPLALKIA